jgi:hypothetical protein
MKLVQLLLPIKSPDETSNTSFKEVLAELTRRCGGVTAYLHAPAEGLWKDQSEVEHDNVVVVEVMDEDFDPDWWFNYRRSLERAFNEEEIVVRVIAAVRV